MELGACVTLGVLQVGLASSGTLPSGPGRPCLELAIPSLKIELRYRSYGDQGFFDIEIPTFKKVIEDTNSTSKF